MNYKYTAEKLGLHKIASDLSKAIESKLNPDGTIEQSPSKYSDVECPEDEELIDTKAIVQEEDEIYPILKERLTLIQKISTDCILTTLEAKFKCHKMILTTASKYFSNLFDSTLSESLGDRELSFPDFPSELLEKVLIFLYFQQDFMKIQNLSCDWFSLCNISQYLMIDELTLYCKSKISDEINHKNVFEYLDKSVQFDYDDLQRACLKFIVDEFYTHELNTSYQEFSAQNPIKSQKLLEILNTHLHLNRFMLSQQRLNLQNEPNNDMEGLMIKEISLHKNSASEESLETENETSSKPEEIPALIDKLLVKSNFFE